MGVRWDFVFCDSVSNNESSKSSRFAFRPRGEIAEGVRAGVQTVSGLSSFGSTMSACSIVLFEVTLG